MTSLRKWLERRFWDFRYGHGTYLAYAIGLFNFIIINYYLLISNVPFLEHIFPRLWVFGIAFSVIYFPLAVIVGWLIYRKRQYKTDFEVSAMENPYRFRAVVPSRETVLNLPFQKLNIQMWMKLFEKEGLMTPEIRKEYEKYLEMIDRLMRGESIES